MKTVPLTLWRSLYGEDNDDLLEALLRRADDISAAALPDRWWQTAVVYALYVERFTDEGTFEGLVEKLDHLVELGATCVWLLPVLESPMRDGGFDISNFEKIRDDIGGDASFQRFVEAVHDRGLRVIFDVAVNHISDEHPWFVDARHGGPKKDWFHWSETGTEFSKARLLFKGMIDSNWTPLPLDTGERYYFHRFYPFQPDLNYRTPEVFAAVAGALLTWVERGVDGFRMDAIPFLWKEDGTSCENLPETHTLLKLFRAVLERARPNALMLAEACQPPADVVQFFGDGDECQGAYHFPLMPRIWLAAALGSAAPIRRAVDPAATPTIPDSCSWFVFLRLHDELTMEFISDAEQDELRAAYLRDPSWSFRAGEGVSARLATLLDGDADRILGVFSILLTIGGTPVIYYGDEFALENDTAHRAEAVVKTGWDDSRFLARGPLRWDEIARALVDDASTASLVLSGLREMLRVRATLPSLAGSEREFLDIDDRVIAYERGSGPSRVTVVVNLSADEVPTELSGRDLLNGAEGPLAPYETRWLQT